MSVRHDWYQTDDRVVVTVLLKNAVDKNYKCSIEENTISLTAENYELTLELLNPILPETSSHKATPHKVEIILMKRDFGRWQNLERKVEVAPTPVITKKKQPEDWDKISKELEKTDDKEEGEQAVNALFRKIYEGASEEQRRAMNKSFSESGGTVLSTNWDEVGKDKVEVKPPDGCEFRKWD